MGSKSLVWRLMAVVLLLVLLVVRTYRSSSLGTQSDEGVHITAAQQVAEGDVLYRDLFENRTPLVYWTLAALFKIVKPGVFAGRLLSQYSTVLAGACLVAVFRIAARYRDRFPELALGSGWSGGLSAVLFFALTPLAVFWSRFAMLEHWQTLFSLLAIVTLFYGALNQGQAWWFAAGVMTALAMLSKQSALTVVAASFIYFILIALDRRNDFKARLLLAWFVGLLISLAIFFLILLSQKSFNNFTAFVSGFDRLDPFLNIAEKLLTWVGWAIRQPFLIFSIIGAIVLAVFGGSPFAIFVLWPVLEAAAVLAPGEVDLGWGGFSHYIVPASAAFSILAGFGFQFLLNQRRKRWVKYGLAAAALLLLISGIYWWQDIRFVISGSEYPLGSKEPEEKIASAIQAITQEDEAILVMANAIFYQESQRRPANLYWHYPEYLRESNLREAAESDIIRALQQPDLDLVAVSRMHLEDRLTAGISDVLWQRWLPVAYFSYPYQRDVFLFTKRQDPGEVQAEVLAEFEPGINLVSVTANQLNSGDLLVGLRWFTEHELTSDLTVFTHVINLESVLVGQNDSIPEVGFRPVQTWQKGEIIEDWHLIDLETGTQLEEHQLGIGLYDSLSGENMPIISSGAEGESYYVWDLEP